MRKRVDARLEIRVASSDVETIERAAALDGESISSWVRRTLLRDAAARLAAEERESSDEEIEAALSVCGALSGAEAKALRSRRERLRRRWAAWRR